MNIAGDPFRWQLETYWNDTLRTWFSQHWNQDHLCAHARHFLAGPPCMRARWILCNRQLDPFMAAEISVIPPRYTQSVLVLSQGDPDPAWGDGPWELLITELFKMSTSYILRAAGPDAVSGFLKKHGTAKGVLVPNTATSLSTLTTSDIAKMDWRS